MRDYTNRNKSQAKTVDSRPQAATYDEGLRAYMLKVYNYMSIGVGITGVVTYFAGHSEAWLSLLFKIGGEGISMSLFGYVVAFLPISYIIIMPMMYKASFKKAQTLFWIYAVLVGLSLSTIFLMYTGASITRVFFMTAATFGGLSLYGYTTKRDLTSWGSLIFVGITVMFFGGLLNMFILKSSAMAFGMSCVGVLLALGLTAFQTQKIKQVYYKIGADRVSHAAVVGALELYWAFLYMFIHLLRLFGDRR